MIYIFKTNVQEKTTANDLLSLLAKRFPGADINIDLDDCDKVLRIETNSATVTDVINTVTKSGYTCSELPD
jgi:hypothetical protein